MDLPKTKKCHKCKKSLIIDDFIGDKKEYSTCNTCRIKVNNKYKKNICELCGISACFNNKELKWGRFCKEHSLPGMVDVKHSKCKYKECNKYPSYNKEGESRPLYCKEHSLPGMVHIGRKLCKYK